MHRRPVSESRVINADVFPHTLMVPDVFGATDDFHQLAATVSDSCHVVDVYRSCGVDRPDPTAGDTAAYEWFQQHVGFEQYAAQVAQAVRNVKRKTRIIGCSVGAAAVWKAAGTETSDLIEYAVCCYGGQIRHMAHLPPRWPVLCVLPEFEPHFDVHQLRLAVARHPRVKVHTLSQHGFLNVHSVGFDRAIRDQFAARLRSLSARDELFPTAE